MWYTRNKVYSEAAEENLQEAKIACDVDSPWITLFKLWLMLARVAPSGFSHCSFFALLS